MKKAEMTIKKLFDTSKTMAGAMLEAYEYPWEVLPHIRAIIETLGENLPKDQYKCVGKNIWIHNSVKIPPTACLGGPTIICEGAEIRTGAYLRGSVLVGAGAVVASDVEPHALVCGVPARRQGWVCRCGESLDASLACPACGRLYRRASWGLEERT